MNKQTLMLTLLIAITPGLAMGASVYKWTDENGVTHFGDRQPVGASSETINVRSGTTSNASGSRPGAQQQLSEIREQQEKDAQQKKESAVEAARRKQREANCATAQANLDIINSNSRIRVEDDGEQRYLSPEEIAEQKNKYEEVVAENCEPENQQ